LSASSSERCCAVVKRGLPILANRILQIVDERPLIRRRQEAAAPERSALRGLRRAEHHEAGKVLVFAAQAVEEPGAEAGTGESLLARVHLKAGAVVIDVVRDHRADEAKIVHASGDVREQFADGRAALAVAREAPWGSEQIPRLRSLQLGLGEGERLALHLGELGLRIEQIHVRWAAGHEEEDDALRFRGELRRLHRERTGGGRVRREGAAEGAFLEQAREPQHAEAVRELPEHLTPRDGRAGRGIQEGRIHGSISG
jgi:hypothetical protein